jgi:hypothetical protein
MSLAIALLVGIIITMVGSGLTMFYQGKYYQMPEQKERWGKNMVRTGIIWIIMSGVFTLACVAIAVIGYLITIGAVK